MDAERRANRALAEPSRLALDYALDLLSGTTKAATIQLLESKYSISLYNSRGEISRTQLDRVMTLLFDSGAHMFLERFDEYMRQKSNAAAPAFASTAITNNNKHNKKTKTLAK